MSKRSAAAFCAFFAASMACSQIASANLLVNGGFDSEPSYGSGVVNGVGCSALTGSQIPGWTIEPGHAVTIHDTSTYPFITGPFSVNTDGEGLNGHNANLHKDFASVAGQQYQVQFDWQGWTATAAACSPARATRFASRAGEPGIRNGGQRIHRRQLRRRPRG